MLMLDECDEFCECVRVKAALLLGKHTHTHKKKTVQRGPLGQGREGFGESTALLG